MVFVLGVMADWCLIQLMGIVSLLVWYWPLSYRKCLVLYSTSQTAACFEGLVGQDTLLVFCHLAFQIFHLSLEMLAGEQGPGCHP